MGRTFRREKSFSNRPPRLHTHRDLPDHQEEFLDEIEYDLIDEEYFYGSKLHTKKQDVERPEGKPADQTDND
tara:strand:+ start:246 stop:461 length:216 start_codon:yes stop_codon:yes gene_type:complete